MAMQRLFSYGTLQLAEVQQATFGRHVDSRADQLIGYRVDMLAISDPEVVRLSGKTHHPIITHSGNPRDVVDGVVLEITDAELAHADAYEVDDYQRVLAPLAGGGEAWVYVARETAAGG